MGALLCESVDLIWYGAETCEVCVSVGIVFESGSLRGGGVVVVRVGGAAMSKNEKSNNLPPPPALHSLSNTHSFTIARPLSATHAPHSRLTVAAVSPPAHLSSLISLHTFFAILYTYLSKAERLANELRRLRQSIHTTPHRRHNNRVRSRLVREATN